MKKIIVIFMLLFLVGCVSPEEKRNEDIYNIYTMAVSANATDLTYEEWLETVRGPQGLPGENGKEVLLQSNNGYIQWQYQNDDTWTNLVDLKDLSGKDGKEVEFEVVYGVLQWRYSGDDTWNELADFSSLYDLGPLIELPVEIDVTNIDMYMGRDDVQYVDLRDYNEKWDQGYIEGFEMVPYYDFLELSQILVRTNGWTFESRAIVDYPTLEHIFNRTKTIVLLCDDGTRSEFVKDALVSIGYLRVHNLGGFDNYNGVNGNLVTPNYDSSTLVDVPSTVDMSTIDLYLGLPNVQYVDVRNFDDKMSQGYIRGFEFIPFFDYIEHMGILSRTQGDWNFETSGEVLNESALRMLFDENKTILLMDASGTRSQYLRDALLSIGYSDVYVVGGLNNYTGFNWVSGDGVYRIEDLVTLPDLPETIDMSNIDEYLGRPDVQYVDVRDFDDKMKSGYIAGFEFIPYFDYLQHSNILVRQDSDWNFGPEDILNESMLRNFFDEDKAIILMGGSGTRAGYIKAALEYLGYENVYNIGGIVDYDGSNMVYGDGSYTYPTN